MLNTGYIEATHGDVTVRIYYDINYSPVGPDQPLVNGPRGYCLDVTNNSGRRVQIAVTLPNRTTTTAQVGAGDPVTSGPAMGRSRTAAQLASLGFSTRGDVAGFQIGEY